jgi:hypothetical protein
MESVEGDIPFEAMILLIAASFSAFHFVDNAATAITPPQWYRSCRVCIQYAGI